MTPEELEFIRWYEETYGAGDRARTQGMRDWAEVAESPEPMVGEGNVLGFLDFLQSLGPNALRQALDRGREFDPHLTYATMLADQGVPWGLAGVIGTAMDFLEPGPGELPKAGAALVGVPIALQRLLAKDLNPGLLDNAGLPAQGFQGSGTGAVYTVPRFDNREGHGHGGAFGSHNPPVSDYYAGRYSTDPFDAPTLGVTLLPKNPVTVPGSIGVNEVFMPATDEARAMLQAMHTYEANLSRDLSSHLSPAVRADRANRIEDRFRFMANQLEAGQLNASMFLHQYRELAQSPGATGFLPDNLTDLHRRFGFDGHIDTRETHNTEVAGYDPYTQAVRTGNLESAVRVALNQGADPAEIQAALKSPIPGSAEVANSIHDVLTRIDPSTRPSAAPPGFEVNYYDWIARQMEQPGGLYRQHRAPGFNSWGWIPTAPTGTSQRQLDDVVVESLMRMLRPK